jgi:hypothetical protein
MAGVGLRALEELGSWRTLAVVERYSHLSLDHLREAAERIVSHATETKASASTPAPQRRQNFGDTASRTSEQRAVVS